MSGVGGLKLRSPKPRMTTDYGIGTLSIIPGRSEPGDSAEQVTQILFGEHYEIIEKRKKWTKVRCAIDAYECWIDAKQHVELDVKFWERLQKQKFIPTSLDVAGIAVKESDQTMIPILMGSSLPFFKEGKFKLGKEVYTYDGTVQMKAAKKNTELLIQHALLYRNAPYLWGGRQPFGIDCSGLSQLCYKMIGINIPRDSFEQADLGHALSFIEEAQPGDLAFFDNEEGRIIHVGILMEDNQIIHASGHVRIDRIDHQGIYKNEIRDYSHRLRIIKRIID